MSLARSIGDAVNRRPVVPSGLTTLLRVSGGYGSAVPGIEPVVDAFVAEAKPTGPGRSRTP
jgi:hypothetical protein